MRKLITLLPIVLGLLAVSSYAGQPIVSTGKESKEYKQVPEETCFNDHEFQVDLFGQYSVGEGPSHAGPMRDHGWGGGLGLNYFFLRNVGIGVDAAWMDIKENTSFERHDVDSNNTALHEFSGSIILRLPLDHLCLAPYIYGGGGFQVDGRQWASAHGGVGLEWRIKPHKLGVFVDARWTYFGDRNEFGDLNNFSARAGVRIVF